MSKSKQHRIEYLQSSADLEMWTGYAFGQLAKQRNHDCLKLSRFQYIENFFQLIQEHHLTRSTLLLLEHVSLMLQPQLQITNDQAVMLNIDSNITQRSL